MSKNENVAQKSTRSLAIDRFRGMAIFLVVITLIVGVFIDVADDLLGNDFATTFPFLVEIGKLFGHSARNGLVLIPELTGLSNRGGLALADLFAPMFIFIVGLTLLSSFKSRERKYGAKVAYLQLSTRFLGLIGAGALLNGLEGWLDVLSGDALADIAINEKIFMFALIGAAGLLLITIVVSLFRNPKATGIVGWVLKGFLALCGAAALFFIMVRTAEIVGGVSSANRAFGSNVWDVLQNIGLSGLIALPFVKLDKWGKLIIAGFFMTFITIFARYGGIAVLTDVIEGGFIGAFGWSTLVLMGSAFEEMKNNRWLFFALALVFIGLSLYMTLGLELFIAKRGGTATYTLLTGGLSAIIYGILRLFDGWNPKFAFFKWWGSNSIVTYVSAFVLALLIGGTLLVTETVLPLWAVFTISGAILVLYTVVNWLLARKERHIRM